MSLLNNTSLPAKCLAILATLLACVTGQAANVTWDGSESSDWATGLNWDNSTGPAAGDVAIVNSGTVQFSAGTTSNLNALRFLSGTLTFAGGTFNATASSSVDSHVEGTLHHTGTAATFNELEIGRTSGDTGLYYLSGGSLRVSRGLADFSLYLGGNKSAVNAGTGTLEISGGALTTRSGVKLGDATLTGTGKFTVLGCSSSQIGIATSTGDTDGTWKQHAGSTLKVGIDFGGVTPIFIDDSATATNGTSATFESGSLLDVGYHATGSGGGTWIVMEVENGDIIDNGLAFAPGVNTAVWSFSIDNSGANGLLKVSAVGPQAGIALNVGNTKKQKMRYGLDYERLWYWYGSTANKNTVARWSMVDCDVDYIRVAMNCEYELTEGVYNLTAYTDKIIPMMTAMKAAKPDLKFFATPRPLNEASGYGGAAWQPYPYWITGDPGDGSSFNFNTQKCAGYLVRYLALMKSYGFKIDFMDLSNEWNVISATKHRDIRDAMLAAFPAAGLSPTTDMPLLVGPSSWSFSQGASWLTGANTTSKKAAIDIPASHNTGDQGTPQDFADKVESIWPGQNKEIWDSEVHGWKGSTPTTEIPTSFEMFDRIRAGFSGLDSWLAIGTTAQGHCYILNDGTNVTRNVKFFIFKKLTTTSNYGNALVVNQPTEFTSTAALIRGNLMTVWVLNNNAGAVPIRITPTGRTIAETTVRRTRWNDVLALEGVSDQIPTTANTSVWSTIAGDSLYCFDVLLNPVGPQFTKIEAESAAVKTGVSTETCTDTGGGSDLGNISNGDSCRFDNLAPGTNSAIRFRIARPAGRPDGRIEVRLDSLTGTVIGSVAVPETGGWQTWETIEATLASVTGTRSLFLKFVESGSSTGAAMFNLNWFSLILPPVPVGLAAIPATSTQTSFSWIAAAGASSHELLRSTTMGGPYTTVATGLTAPTFTDTGLTAGTSYYYVVRATYPDVVSTNSAEIRTVPSNPIVLSDLVIGSTTIGSDGAGGSKITLRIAKSGIGQFYQAVSAPDLTSASWPNASGVFMGNGGLLQIDVPITAGSPRYFYKVKAWRE